MFTDPKDQEEQLPEGTSTATEDGSEEDAGEGEE